MLIRRCTEADEPLLFSMLRDEGSDWEDYYGDAGREQYRRALRNSVTYLAFEEGRLCGYARCREDDGFGVYVYDLLVAKAFRGRQIGRVLMERACTDFPGQTVYVMSDVDGYYEKLGYAREGSIFIVNKQDV